MPTKKLRSYSCTAVIISIILLGVAAIVDVGARGPPLHALFVNEAAYYEKDIAFALAEVVELVPHRPPDLRIRPLAVATGRLARLDAVDDGLAVRAVMDRLPSSSSSEFGEPFLDIFERYDRDFYKIDKMLFSPASVRIENQATGTIWDVGEIRYDVLRRSFGIE